MFNILKKSTIAILAVLLISVIPSLEANQKQMEVQAQKKAATEPAQAAEDVAQHKKDVAQDAVDAEKTKKEYENKK